MSHKALQMHHMDEEERQRQKNMGGSATREKLGASFVDYSSEDANGVIACHVETDVGEARSP